MHFGIFAEELRHGRSQAESFRDVFELAERADSWGIDCVWLGEIHFTPTRSVISASLQVASAIAARTRRLRVGTAVPVVHLAAPIGGSRTPRFTCPKLALNYRVRGETIGRNGSDGWPPTDWILSNRL